jgi:hypothetical protein
MTATSITCLIARDHLNELRCEADHRRLSRELRRAGRAGFRSAAAGKSPTTSAPAVTLRFACAEDDRALERLAQLDSARTPRAPQLVAEVGGQLRAALSLTDGAVVANPFDHTSELVNLLRARAAQLSGQRPKRPGRFSVLARLVGVRQRERLAAS